MRDRSDGVRIAEAVLVEGPSEKRACDAAFISQILAASVCIFVTIFVGLAAFHYGIAHVMYKLISLLPESPSWSWYVLMCLATMLAIVAILPIWPLLCMLNGLVFGIVHGSILNFVAIFGAAFISLLLGRTFCQSPVRSCIFGGDYPTFKGVLMVVEDNDNTMKFLLLFRFLFIPMFIRNYGPSILEVPMWKVLISVVPHGIWVSLLFASLGSSFQDAAQLLRKGKELSAKSFKWQQALIVCVGFILTMVLTCYAHSKYREKLDDEDAAPLGRAEAREVMHTAQA